MFSEQQNLQRSECWPPQAAKGGPARSDSAVWGRSVQRSQRIACRPSGIDPGVRPSEHRRGRSARKAAPAPKPVGAARSGRSLLNCAQQLSRRPGIDRPCFWQGRSTGADVNSALGNSRLGWVGGTMAVRSARSARTMAPPGAQSRILSCVPQYTIRAGIRRLSLDRDAVQDV